MVDEAMRMLKRDGISRAFVAASGDILVSRAPLNRPGWKIEVRDVDEFGNIYPRTIYLNNCALSTSGDTEQSVEINGSVFSHIVDPRTGIGLTSRIQVSVISASSTLSDCFATAICVLGKEEGLQFADTRKLFRSLVYRNGSANNPTHVEKISARNISLGRCNYD